MADESLSIELFIEADKAKMSLGDLRDGFKDLEEELEKVDRSTVEGQKRFRELSTAMAQTGSEIKNIELGFESLDTDQVASEMGGLAGSVGDVTAAFVLLGGENETMQEFAETIEKAMAISIGFKGAIEGLSSARKLHNNLVKTGRIAQMKDNLVSTAAIVKTKALAAAKRVAGLAMKAFNAIVSLNPLGIIILAISAAVAAFFTFKDAIMDMIDTAMKPFIKFAELVKKALQALGIVAADSVVQQNEASKQRAAQLKKDAQAAEDSAERQIKAITRLTDETIRQIDRDIERRKAAGEEYRDLEKQKLETLKQSVADQIAENEKLTDELARIAEEQQANGDWYGAIQTLSKKQIASDQIAIDKEKQEELLFQDELFNIEQAKLDEEAEADAKKRREEAHKAKMEQLQKQFEAEKEAWLQQTKDIVEVQRKGATIIRDERQEEGEKTVLDFSLIMGAMVAEEQKRFEETKAIAEADNAVRQKQLDRLQSGLEIMNSLSDIFVSNEKKRDKIKRALAVGQLAIDTARAISAGIAASAGVPFPGNIGAILTTVATVLANVAQAKQLLSQGGAGGGADLALPTGGGAAGGGAAISPVSNTSTIIDQPQTQATVAVVEINEVQNNVNVAEQNATLG